MKAWHVLDVFCILELLYLYYAERHHNVHDLQQSRHFQQLLIGVLAALAADAFSRMTGDSALIFAVSVVAMIVRYSMLPVIMLLFFRYLWVQFPKKRKHELRWLMYVLMAASIVNFVLVVSSPVTRLLFYYDSMHVYYRGRYWLITAWITLLAALATEFSILHSSDDMERKYARTLLFFELPVIASGVLQIINEDISYVYAGLTFSILVIYLGTQNRNMDVDHLTGAYSRPALDLYLEHLARNDEGDPFGVIMMDLDCFKEINDVYGHRQGDQALEDATGILKQSMRADDFIARYGGDEFCAVIRTDNPAVLEKIMEKIHRNEEYFARRAGRAYTISFSMGYAIYDRLNIHSVDSLLKQADSNMYNDKQAHGVRR